MTPHDSGAGSAPQATPIAPVARHPHYTWYHKLSAVIFITFCLEIGLFLLIFPWTDYWSVNFFSTAVPVWAPYWDNMYLRGAVSGLGVVNLYISLIEIFRLRRFARP